MVLSGSNSPSSGLNKLKKLKIPNPLANPIEIPDDGADRLLSSYGTHMAVMAKGAWGLYMLFDLRFLGRLLVLRATLVILMSVTQCKLVRSRVSGPELAQAYCVPGS